MLLCGTAAGSLAIPSSAQERATETARPMRETEPSSDVWIRHSEDPPNREVRLESLVESYITPTERFYVRSHAKSPSIDPQTFRLRIDGMVREPLEWSLDDLKDRFETVTVTATMTCAGNRRFEHSKTQAISGVPWREGAIGNATWTGYRLCDVLQAAGVAARTRHIWFNGLDEIDRGSSTIAFGASIPIHKAMADGSGDGRGMPGAIVCTHMNGRPLTPDHGFPLRTVVPGYIGARSVKWLGHIHASEAENPNHYQSTAYKVLDESTPLRWAEEAPIYRFPLNAVTCKSQRSADGSMAIAGYALPPGQTGVTIDRVEYSVDGGHRWTAARLIGPSDPMCWQLWRGTIASPPESGSLWVRAIDSRGRQQPDTTAWNLKGYLYNAVHRREIPPSDADG